MRRLLIPALFALALLALLVWAFAPRPVPVETAQALPRSFSVTVAEEGEARIREVYTVSAPITGRLQRIALQPGDAVEADKTVVVRIGPVAPALLDARARAVAEAAVAAAEAAVDLARALVIQAEATQEYAATEAERAQQLYDRAALSQRLLDNAILARRTADAAVESARANLAVRGRELDSARAVLADGAVTPDERCCVEIVTPVSGRILRVMTEDEQVVQPGMPIIEIGNPGNLEIVVHVLSRDAVRIVPGAGATITGWGGPPLQAVVDRIEPAAATRISALGIEEQRVEVILSLTGTPDDWQALGHGFRVIAGIEVWRGAEVLSIPVGALFRDGSDWAAFAVAEGRARLRILRIGERNEDLAQVLEGLAEGEQVILHPGDAVADGVRVAPLAE